MSRVPGGSRGASPVVGVVMLVGIAVVLAAVAGAFALDLTDRQPTAAPQVAVVADYDERTTGNGEYLNLTFESGDVLDRETLSIAVTGAASSDGSDATLTGDPIQSQAPAAVSAGTELSIHAGQFSGVASGEHLDLTDATLRLVWTPENDPDAETYVLYRWPEPSRRT
ncbi:type IV pilin [Haloarcula salina]|uniref:type IV pilin n=1 Tax=Haloarcula salina TaxID=1429914 RepID=UPI003C6F3847